MKKWLIGKEFDFCYGHRVWSQELNEEYSLDSKLKCRHLHGHQGKLVVYLEDTKLKSGMVTDFKHLNWFKKWVDDVLDHKFIMDLNDPLLSHEYPVIFRDGEVDFNTLIEDKSGFWVINPDYYQDLIQPLQEKYEGGVFVNFIPTSENLSQWLFNVVQEKMSKINVTVSGVSFFETPKSQSNYYE